MSHPIEERIGTLRSRVRRLIAVHGLSWTVVWVLAVVMSVGLIDYLIRFQDPGLRVICSLLVLGTLIWTCRRYLYLPLLTRLSDVELALRVQRRFPGLEDRLASSVGFLKQSEGDPVAGSAALRRAVIAQATAETERLEFSEVVDRRPVLRAAIPAVSLLLVAAILVGLGATREASAIAVVRLAMPLRDTPWPQKTHLMLCRQVSRVARGRAFEVEVVDREGARLPKDVQIHYRFEGPDGSTSTETEPMRFVDSQTATRGLSGAVADLRKRGMMVARREKVSGPFSYRIEGGDDSLMPWYPVEVVEPPGLESVRVRLIPPAYTGWAPQTAKGRFIRALSGTRVRISGQANRRLQSAVLSLADGFRIVAGPNDPERRGVAAEFVIENLSGEEKLESVSIALTDQDRLPGEESWEIRTLPDRPPTASIRQPSDTVFVTSKGVVPLDVVATDDLAIRRLELVFGQIGPADEGWPGLEESVVRLYSGPETVEPQQGGGLSQGAELGERREVEYRWELADFGLPPGTELAVRAVAEDYRPQIAESQRRRLVVITAEDLQERIAEQERLILAELRRVLRMQQGSRKQVRALQIRLAETGRLAQLDVDRLQGAELNQRDVSNSLKDRSTGVPMHVLAVLAELDNNRQDSPDVRRRMLALLDEIEWVDREHLARIGRELTTAIKSAETRLQRLQEDAADEKGDEQPGDHGAVADSLAEAGDHQDEVIGWLEGLLDRLAEWDEYRRFHREISHLLQEQVDLRERSDELGSRTLGKQRRDLLPQEAADLEILAGEQLELARQLDRVQQQMDQAASELAEGDPLAAGTLGDAVAEARRLGISGQMLSTGGQLRENRIGQATAQQAQIERDLQEVLDILANRREHELARLLQKLDEAEADLARIAEREAAVRSETEAAAKAADQRPREDLERLGREQARLQAETERLARRLERLMAEKVGQSLRQAAGHMGQGGQRAGQGDPGGAAKGAAAAEEAVRQAQQQLAARRQEIQAQLAMEQLTKLADTLKQLRGRQEKVLEETQRIAGLQAAGDLSRGQAASLRSLADRQGLLGTETQALGDGLTGAGAFRLILSRAAGHMGEAAALLAQDQTGGPTQDAERDALGRIDLLLEALKRDPPPGGGDGGSGGGQPGQGGRPQAVRLLAELKLLKLLQEEVNRRTAELQESFDAEHEMTDQQRRQYAALSEEQGRLADLTWQLLQQHREGPEDGLLQLPE